MPSVFGNEPTNGTAQWKPEPTQRGTYSILSSCLVTMFLCVWTAVHLNLPAHKESGRQALRKVKWLLTALLAPELVAYTAYKQRKEAIKICNIMRELQGLDPLVSLHKKVLRFMWRSTETPRCVEADGGLGDGTKSQRGMPMHPWTLVHGFYAVMGGYAIDTSKEEQPYLRNDLDRATLTPFGLHFITCREASLIPDISKREIQDKSKASNLAKAIVCIQASWFCIQCITRLAAHLSISLLELNTFGHSICTLLVYLLWWDKPLDVEEPTSITDERTHPICAFMGMMCGDIGPPWKSVHFGGNGKSNISLSEIRASTAQQDIHSSDEIQRLAQPVIATITRQYDFLCRQTFLATSFRHSFIYLTSPSFQ